MKPLPIIYVEDLQDDVLFLTLALKRAGVTNPLVHLPNLSTATEFFDHAFQSKEPLGAVVLDQNIAGFPSKGLKEVITTRFPSLPVIEITGSNLSAEAEQPGLESRFFIKPRDLVGWAVLVSRLKEILG
jgi:hypothetical protein